MNKRILVLSLLVGVSFVLSTKSAYLQPIAGAVVAFGNATCCVNEYNQIKDGNITGKQALRILTHVACIAAPVVAKLSNNQDKTSYAIAGSLVAGLIASGSIESVKGLFVIGAFLGTGCILSQSK